MKQQFDLSIWLQNKSRKIVTRRGNPVRIICTDRKHGEDNLLIVFLEECSNGEFLLTCRKDGRNDTYDTPYDLFFADDGEEMTEFESNLADLLVYNHPMDIKSAESIAKRKSEALLDLARKEILKDLPKWKKAKETLEFSDNVVKMDEYGTIFTFDRVWKGEYYINPKSLKSLPKKTKP